LTVGLLEFDPRSVPEAVGVVLGLEWVVLEVGSVLDASGNVSAGPGSILFTPRSIPTVRMILTSQDRSSQIDPALARIDPSYSRIDPPPVQNPVSSVFES
jgi:hypothetical protein